MEPLALRLSAFAEELVRAKRSFSDCPGCESRTDFQGRLADFKEYADSLISAFQDSSSALTDERRDVLSDSFEGACDSLSGRRDGFIDNRLGDIDTWRFGLSRLAISFAYASHSSYRGRDNGLLQQAFSPSVAYRHSSGLSLQASTSWLDATTSRWDNIQLTGGYDFRFSGVAGGSLSYTHFWFSDSSRSELSVFTDNALCELSFDWPLLSIDMLGSMNFGKASEFSLTTAISHAFEIPLNLYNRITINPTLSWFIGQQNSELTTLLTTKANGKRAVAVTTIKTLATSTFSVLDYEISLPATIEIGPVTVAPSATYIIPLNVVDASTRKSFVNLECSLFLTIR